LSVSSASPSRPGTAYWPPNQRPRSIWAQRGEQKGSAEGSAGLLQIGHVAGFMKKQRLFSKKAAKNSCSFGFGLSGKAQPSP
jgi:hypothetical protein